MLLLPQLAELAAQLQDAQNDAQRALRRARVRVGGVRQPVRAAAFRVPCFWQHRHFPTRAWWCIACARACGRVRGVRMRARAHTCACICVCVRIAPPGRFRAVRLGKQMDQLLFDLLQVGTSDLERWVGT